MDWNDPNYSVLHTFTEHVLIRNHNDAMIQKLDSPKVSTDATGQLPKV